MIIPLTGENRVTEAEAIPSPKHIWIDGDRVVVYTGEHIPQEEINETNNL